MPCMAGRFREVVGIAFKSGIRRLMAQCCPICPPYVWGGGEGKEGGEGGGRGGGEVEGEGGGYGRASKRMVPSSSNSRHAEIGGTMSKI